MAKIGILGTGDVGKALGTAFVTLGYEVKMGSRTAGNDKARAWVEETGSHASEGTFEEAAAFGDLIVLATLGVATESAIRQAGTDNFKGKVVIDATNPLDFSKGMPPSLAADHGGEQIQQVLAGAHVVKAFNTVGSMHMFRPDFPAGPPDMFICGDSEEAKAAVSDILKEFGWDVVDIGGIGGSHYLEAMCMVWVLHGLRANSWDHAFKLLRR